MLCYALLSHNYYTSHVRLVTLPYMFITCCVTHVQFQLTINLVALVVAFVAAVTTGETPLNVLQLLWVNLIMDALAALGKLTAMHRFSFRLCLDLS